MAAGCLGRSLARIPVNQCFKELVCNEKNHLTQFVAKTKNIDKTIKVAKSLAELVVANAEVQGIKGAEIKTAQNIASAAGMTRNVIGLANVFNGVIPGTVSSVGKCAHALRGLFSGNSGGNAAHDIAAHGCQSIAGSTYIATFGVVRPLLLANKLSAHPFLSPQTKASLGNSVTYMMAANHAASVVGGAIAVHDLVSERAAAKDSSIEKEQGFFAKLQKLILGIVEKVCELIADIFKIIPLGLSAGSQVLCASVCTSIAAVVGLYAAWSAS